ncbi:MAG TPA: hypothetical protein QF509_04605 [Rhodospirillales bacterium]|nr:hypothetical protein [Rhodospirillales bacterium]
MPKTLLHLLFTLLTAVVWLSAVDDAAAHHVLGRPSYSLNEDSNTPPSLQAETRIGDFLVTYMAFPAFPRPEQPGRIYLYASRIDDGTPYQGKVTFRVRADSWFSWLGMDNNSEKLGVQSPDGNVFRQGYMFHEAGDYIISAASKADEVPYTIDFPLRIGEPVPVGPIGIIAGLLVVVLVSVSMMQRRRSMTGKIRSDHDNNDPV